MSTVTPASPSPETLREAELLLARCDELATHSRHADRLERVHLTPEHAAVNALAAEWMREAGMTTWRDAAGNQCGRLGSEHPARPALLLGSHLDTVPDAGRYDGMLGVLLAIQVVQRLRHVELPFDLEVVAFSDEEGTRFGNALSGSRAYAGQWREEWFDLRDGDGVSLRQAFVDFGLDPVRVADAARRPEEFVGYLEAHIEQAPYLEDGRRALGVVTSIAAARRFTITLTGHAGHAGGTPYDRRRDALVGASEAILAIERIGKATDTIATVGRASVEPGGVNVIPGRVEFSLDLRAEHDAARDGACEQIFAELEAIARSRGLRLEHEEIYRADGTPCAPELQEAVAAGIRTTGDTDPLRLWSRAGHDGMSIAGITDIAMLFVRCAGGVSHHPEESVTLDDVAVALDAFEAAVRAFADRPAGR